MDNLHQYDQGVKREDRETLLKQKAVALWFTGLSGSGKSTIAEALQKKLFKESRLTYVLDGDNIRCGLNANLDFSPAGRKENIRRVGEVTKLFVDAGMITLVCFISPYQEDRNIVREKLKDHFVEVHVKCSLEVCEKRDPHGLYQKSRKGEIKEFTGINAPYEEPSNPEITINTEESTVEECIGEIYNYLLEKMIL